MKIILSVVEHSKQRYETCGDWYYDANGSLHIVASKMEDARYEQLVQFHELIEAQLCDAAGVTQEDVDQFDIAYETKRPRGDESEPGDDPTAPYFKQHQFATQMERTYADALGVDWFVYVKAIQALYK